jgi:arylsulfatase A-like enzyme
MRNPNFSLPAMYRAYEQDPELQALPNPAVVRDYYAAISALDHNLGRLLTGLDELGLADDTIVVFTSDHGDMMYSQRAAQKNHPWDESLLVPFLIRYPAAIPAGTRISAPFNTVDILPTLLELAGVAAPEFAEGTSFAGAVRGLDQSLPEAAYILCAWPWILPEWRGIRTEDHTYVEAHAGPLLLFDNRNDPYQMENLVNRPEHRDLQERLRRVYRRMAAQVGDPFDPWPVVRERMERTREAWRHRHAHLLETAR